MPKSNPLQKHDDDCLRRKSEDPRYLFFCTCDLSDDEVVEGMNRLAKSDQN